MYILSLAGLDLLCALVSTPREVWNLVAKLQEEHGVHGNLNYSHNGSHGFDHESRHYYCNASTYLTYLFNLSSALLLIFIAITRYLKVKKGHDQVKVKGAWVVRKAWAGLRDLNSPRGAKLASFAAFLGSLVMCLPILVAVVLPETESEHHKPKHMNATCIELISVDVRFPVQTLYYVMVFFMALSLIVLYGAVLCKIWKRHRKRQKHTPLQSESPEKQQQQQRQDSRRNSVSILQQHSLGSLREEECDDTKNGPREYVRSMSMSEAANLSAAVRGKKSRITFNRSLSNPDTKNEMTCVHGQHLQHQGHGQAKRRHARANSDVTSDVMPSFDVNAESFFPPISYSAHMRSLLSLHEMSVSKTNEVSEGQGEGQGRRVSVSSLQLTKGGHHARESTVMFVLITVIYIVSYIPFFTLEVLGQGHEGAVMETLWRSYLISSAANPLVYGACNLQFRKSLRKLVKCHRDVM